MADFTHLLVRFITESRTTRTKSRNNTSFANVKNPPYVDRRFSLKIVVFNKIRYIYIGTLGSSVSFVVGAFNLDYMKAFASRARKEQYINSRKIRSYLRTSPFKNRVVFFEATHQKVAVGYPRQHPPPPPSLRQLYQVFICENVIPGPLHMNPVTGLGDEFCGLFIWEISAQSTGMKFKKQIQNSVT